VTSLYEIFIERMEYDDTFHTFLIVTSLYEVFVEGMEYDDTFHTFLIVTFIPSINTSVSEVTMIKGMKGVIVLHPLNNYFIQ
jgi:hypothetical protein